ncbi:MAG: hypothetical protein AAFQ82_27270, partial [Myxococcota bacterium]
RESGELSTASMLEPVSRAEMVEHLREFQLDIDAIQTILSHPAVDGEALLQALAQTGALAEVFRALPGNLGDLFNRARSDALAGIAIDEVLDRLSPLENHAEVRETLVLAYRAYATRTVQARRAEIAAEAMSRTAGYEPAGAMSPDRYVERVLGGSPVRQSSIQTAHRLAQAGVFTGQEYRTFVGALADGEPKDGAALNALVDVVGSSFQSVDPTLFSAGLQVYVASEADLRRVLLDLGGVSPNSPLNVDQRNALAELRSKRRFSESQPVNDTTIGALLDELLTGNVAPRDLGLE